MLGPAREQQLAAPMPHKSKQFLAGANGRLTSLRGSRFEMSSTSGKDKLLRTAASTGEEVDGDEAEEGAEAIQLQKLGSGNVLSPPHTMTPLAKHSPLDGEDRSITWI